MVAANFTYLGAMFVFVFTKAFQQRNVSENRYLPVIPTSLVMALCEFYVIAAIVRIGFDLGLVLAAGTGAGLGAMAAMAVHSRIFRAKVWE
jgi:hypothetical protein